jgi:hypothetical protein
MAFWSSFFLSQKGPLIILFFSNWLVVTGTMEFYDFPFSWEWKIIPTNELTPSFFIGVG